MIWNESKKKPEDKKTQQRIHEHLLNEKDVITEEDIKNARTDALIAAEDTVTTQDVPAKITGELKEIAEKENGTDNTDDAGTTTPWSILGS